MALIGSTEAESLVSEINAVLAWLHIFTSIGWMGTAMFFVMVMGPLMPHLSPATLGELALKLFPRLTRFIFTFATLTLLFGVSLAFGKAGARLELLAPDNPWGFRITIGALLAAISYLLSLMITIPTAKKMVRLVQEMQRSQQKDPPQEMFVLQNRIRAASIIVLLMLTVVLIFMVLAARL
jgi:uncharacterized membrane protein